MEFLFLFLVSFAAVIVLICSVLLVLYLLLKRRERRTEQARSQLIKEYMGGRNAVMPSFPYNEAVYNHTQAPGQKFEFVIPGRLHGDDYGSGS